MGVFYLVHPIHGAKVANSEAEVLYDITNGWSRFELPKSSGAVKESDKIEVTETIEETEVTDTIEETVRKKQGRPFKKSASTDQEDLLKSMGLV